MTYLPHAVAGFYALGALAYLLFLFRQKNHWDRSGFYLMIAGFLLHTILIAIAFTASGQVPVHNLRETLSFAAWIFAGLFIGFQYKFQLKILGVLAAPLAMLAMIAASFLPVDPVETQSIFNSLWLFFHIIAIFIGDAAFALACGLGIFYLIQERTIKKKRRGFFFKRLPSLERIDSTGYASIVLGFTMLTIGLITGFAYAKAIWGRFWSWDPKEIWSGIAWLLYAALLHGRISMGWRGRKAAMMAIVGFIVLMFTFFGVNFILHGHHGEFTKW
ncbi:MAG: c-type cytochrome biogenesis protein CcsB [Deltaproteobacteria bacterium]